MVGGDVCLFWVEEVGCFFGGGFGGAVSFDVLLFYFFSSLLFLWGGWGGGRGERGVV